MNHKSFDTRRIAEGYAKRPWLHRDVMEEIRKDCGIWRLTNGLDVGCGAGLSTKALRLLCDHVTGTDISSEMIAVCNQMYEDDSYCFMVAEAEATPIPETPYDIITAAGVIQWIDRERFLDNAALILKPGGYLIVYDFWITNQMMGNDAYTKWYQEQYLVRYPKPYRQESVWTQEHLSKTFLMEKQTNYSIEYEFSEEEFVDFMMIQSNVNEKIAAGTDSLTDARRWMQQTLHPIFGGKKQTLRFQGYNWYIRKTHDTRDAVGTFI